MANAALTPSQENYLERIARLAETGPVQVTELARSLGVKLPSVSRAVKGLADLGLVHHESYGAVEMTASGEQVAAGVLRRRECVEHLMRGVLGLTSEEAAIEADRLQHVISRTVLLRLEALVEFGMSSEAWLKRLQLRIRSAEELALPEPPVGIGQTELHAVSKQPQDKT
jgi:DtxR family Mn-dependent transcriptional regulator